VHPLARDVVVAGGLGFAASFQHHGCDDERALDMADPPDSHRCQLCRETSVSDVVKSTAPATPYLPPAQSGRRDNDVGSWFIKNAAVRGRRSNRVPFRLV
jgi:hypothetical protein